MTLIPTNSWHRNTTSMSFNGISAKVEDLRRKIKEQNNPRLAIMAWRGWLFYQEASGIILMFRQAT